MKFGIRGQLINIITYVKFLVNQFRGYGVLTPHNCHIPLTCCVALTTMYALLCDTVINNLIFDFRALAYTSVERLCAVFLYMSYIYYGLLIGSHRFPVNMYQFQ